MILGGLVLGVAIAVNIPNFNTYEETRFVQISVLAENHANYGVDENSGTVPAVSIEILEDKLHDVQSSIPIIRYTSLPAEEQESEGQDNDVQPADKGKVHDNHGNNGNGNSNQQGGGNTDPGNSGNSGTNNNKGDENKPDKNTGQKNETNNGPQPDANPNKTK